MVSLCWDGGGVCVCVWGGELMSETYLRLAIEGQVGLLGGDVDLELGAGHLEVSIGIGVVMKKGCRRHSIFYMGYYTSPILSMRMAICCFKSSITAFCSSIFFSRLLTIGGNTSRFTQSREQLMISVGVGILDCLEGY